MMNRYISTLLVGSTLAVFLPIAAHAYLNPYDVLLSDTLLIPSQPRATVDRVERQQNESAARREREQEAIFSEQNPEAFANIASDVDLDELFGSASDEDFDALLDEFLAEDAVISPEEREFNSLLRALERIKTNQEQAKADAQIRQQAFLLLEEADQLHGGAPMLPGRGNDLAPTGAGSILAMVVMFLAGLWTIRKVRQNEKVTQTS